MKAKKTQRRSQTGSRTESQPNKRSAAQLQDAISTTLPEPRFVPSLIIGLTFLVFLPVLSNGFVDSDTKLLVENLGYHGLGWSQLQWMFTGFHFGQFHPIAWLSLGVNHVLWWTDPFGYHLVNLSIHIANGVIFYHIALTLLVRYDQGNPSPSANSLRLPGLISVLCFAIHPLRVESVAWASARGDLIAAMFFLLSLLSYLKANDDVAGLATRTSWKYASLGMFFLSLLAGPSGLLLPAVLCILDRTIGGGAGSSQRRIGAIADRSLSRQLPFILLACAYALVALIAAGYHEPSDQASYRVGPLTWALSQLSAPALYLWSAVLPIGLAPGYELTAVSVAVFVTASLVLSALVVVLRRKWPAIVPLWLCYLLLLLPVFRDGFPVRQVLADRFTYLAALPWALLIGGGVARGFKAMAVRGARGPVLFSGAVTIAAGLTLLGVLTWRLLPVWHDAETLWRNAAATNPTGPTYYNLAMLSEAQGDFQNAALSYRRALELNPERWDIHERAGALSYKQGKMADAVEHYRGFVQFSPNSIDAREKLATALISLDQPREAVEHLRKVIQLSPDSKHARIKLGTILAVNGSLDEAADVLAIAAKKDANDGRLLLQLGRVLAAQGKLDKALGHFHEAARLLPNDAEIQESLGQALLELGRKDQAAKHLAEAVRILRSSPTAR